MNKKGFTLIELLVTIVIIGIVTAIAFPSIRGLKATNADKKYKSLAVVLKNGAKLYSDERKYDLGNCTKLNYSELKTNGYVKNNHVNIDENCDNSYVYIRKNGNKYKYYSVVICNSIEKYRDNGTPSSC